MFSPSFSCDEVYPGLFQGSKIRDSRDTEKVESLKINTIIDLEGGFDLPLHFVDSYLYWHFYDLPLLPDLNLLVSVASFGKMELRHHRRVLVHCTQGLNRSGLVCAVIMALDEMPGPDILKLIRLKRPGSLWNPVFAEYVKNLSPGGP